MQQLTYIIITHGSSQLGMGHFSRAKNTETYLRELGNYGMFFVNDNKESRSYFQHCDNALFYSKRTDHEVLLPLLTGKPLIIFDCNDTSKEEVLFFKDRGCKVATFDDLGAGRDLADILINANLDEDNSSEKHLFGEHFICLGNSFKNIASRKKIPSRTKKVFISIGGYDEKQFSLTLFRGIFYAFYYSLYETFEIHLKLPSSGGDINTIFQEADYYHKLDIQQEGNRYNIAIDDIKDLVLYTYDEITDMSHLILESDILFTSGGLTVYEGLTTGTYTLAFPQNQAEKKVIDRLLRKGYLPADIDTNRLQEDLEYIFELSEVEFESFFKKSQSSFDGLGYQRVGNALLKLLP